MPRFIFDKSYKNGDSETVRFLDDSKTFAHQCIHNRHNLCAVLNLLGKLSSEGQRLKRCIHVISTPVIRPIAQNILDDGFKEWLASIQLNHIYCRLKFG